ncbi:DUF932 domain-containing protein [Undibacterium sp. TJN25]|uniref:DUF932 domain-containing protein n=1 Tax=Undibacterium sp. TJN25 TaxID=3413056 RepID=UPI003BF39938
MSHLVETMAYVDATPWHCLGNRLSAKQSIEVWAQQSGISFEIKETPVRFITESAGGLGAVMSFPEQKVLFRSDTNAPLSVVSQRYQVVQPREILEFYRDLTEISGFELETAGVLEGFMYRMKTLSERRVKSHEAMNYFLRVFTDPATTATGLTNERAIKKVQELYDGQGKGAELVSSKSTAFGLLNAITQYVDHERRAKSADHRLESAWFGQGANLKQKALDQALLMAN